MSTAFRIEMDNVQEVPDTVSTATGLGTVVFDRSAVTATYNITVAGLDFGEVLGIADQTPDPGDDVHGIHVHNAARGVNGSVVFGQRGPTQDTDDFAIVENSNGTTTFSGIWETTDPASSSLNNFAAALGAATLGSDVPLYWNIHTEEFGGGEIRGQWVCIATDNGETVEGTDGDDILPGLGGDDTVNGGLGNDTLEGGADNDTLNGGSGRDTASYAGAAAGVTVALGNAAAQNTVGAGTDTLSSMENLTGSNFADTLSGTSGDNTISGGGDNDTLTGFSGNDTLNGGDGFDTLNGGGQNDTLSGGAGDDTATYQNASAGVTVALGTTTAQNTVGDGTDTLSSIENLIGSNFADTLSGTTGNNTISGGNNSDNIRGFSGNDTLNGDAGTDTLNGGAHDNSLNGGDNDDTLIGQDGNDTLIGGNGIDTASYVGAIAGVTVSLGLAGAQNTVGDGTNSLSSIENLIGSNFGDTLSGTGGDNTISGGGNSDDVKGFSGNDTLNGDAGTELPSAIVVRPCGVLASGEGEIARVDGVDVADGGEQDGAGAVVDEHAGAGVGQRQVAEIVHAGDADQPHRVGAVLEIGDGVGAVVVLHDELVGPAAAGERVVAVLADQVVVVGAAIQRVVVGAAVQQVVAVVAVQNVDAGEAHHRVVVVAAGEHIVAAAAVQRVTEARADHVLHGRQRIGAVAHRVLRGRRWRATP